VKTLVIHPNDRTTDFLGLVYEDKPWTVINGAATYEELTAAIREHDRIVMLGHGTPHGLIGHRGFAVSASMADLLYAKQCVSIWCHANLFHHQHGLPGFYSGMIISEVAEAALYDIVATQAHVDTANALLAVVLRSALSNTQITREHVVAARNQLAACCGCPITAFNSKRLFHRAPVPPPLHFKKSEYSEA